MPNVHVTVDGIEVSVPAGSTILDAADVAGIDIPVLCDHPALEPIGACRICLVEVEKQNVLQPACTFRVVEGMVVHTESPRAIESRRFMLQLLFSERNHFCMYCQMSGSCDLQDLAYRYGLDHWEYERAFPRLPVDASGDYFVMDHNRCILCRRCVRACDELVGNRTLGVKDRGSETMIIADMGIPLGESSCVSCGTCLQVCPTGALMDRASAYMGATDEITRIESRCVACSVGCGVELIVRENRVIRVEGDWDAEPNHGLLCEVGRFGLLNEKRQRLRTPLVKGEDGLEETSWDRALSEVAAQLKAAGDKVQAVVSGFASTEAAKAVVESLPGEKTSMAGISGAEGHSAPLGRCDPLSALDEADMYIVVDTDLTDGSNCQVVSFAIKRGVRHRGARLILLDEQESGLDPWAFYKWPPAEADRALEIARNAQVPVIVYGVAGAKVAQSMAKELSNAKVIALAPEGNSLGLMSVGVNAPFGTEGATALYVLAGEAEVDAKMLDALGKADFVAVQACFREPWDEVADVILPSPTMHEKSGTMTNTEGRVGEIVAAVTTELPSEVEVVERLGVLLQ